MTIKFNAVQCLNCGTPHALDVPCPLILSRVELPCPQCARFRAKLLDKETQGRIMHETWTRTKREQGFHHPNEMPSEGWYDSTYHGTVPRPHRCGKCHDDLIPWEQLPEKQKDINRHAFDAIIKHLTE